MIQAHVFVFGFVQGVGFRHFVRSKANELSLNGWVRNLPDRGVEAIFQGSKSSIEEMIKLCKKGPFLSEVEDIQVKWESVVDKFEDFMIL